MAFVVDAPPDAGPEEVLAVNALGVRYLCESMYEKINPGGCVTLVASIAAIDWTARLSTIDDLPATETSRLRTFVDPLIERDTSILERVAAHSGYAGWRSGVEFQADAAALRARRVVRVLLDQEAGRAPIRPGWAPAPAAHQPVTAPEGARS